MFRDTKKQWRSPNAVWNDIIDNYKVGINNAAIRNIQPRLGKISEDYANAIIEINGVISNLQNAINNLNSAVTNINDGYYDQAKAQIAEAIAYVR